MKATRRGSTTSCGSWAGASAWLHLRRAARSRYTVEARAGLVAHVAVGDPNVTQRLAGIQTMLMNHGVDAGHGHQPGGAHARRPGRNSGVDAGFRPRLLHGRAAIFLRLDLRSNHQLDEGRLRRAARQGSPATKNAWTVPGADFDDDAPTARRKRNDWKSRQKCAEEVSAVHGEEETTSAGSRSESWPQPRSGSWGGTWCTPASRTPTTPRSTPTWSRCRREFKGSCSR